MDNRKVIIIALIAVIVVLGGLIAYSLFTQNQVQYQTIAVSNATTMEVPVSKNLTFINDTLGIKYYQDDKSGVQVISWNGQEQASAKGSVNIASQFEKQKAGTTQSIINGVPVYENKKLGCFIIEVKNATTNDNIIIVAKDKNMALHMLKSIKFGVSNITNAAQVEPYTESDEDHLMTIMTLSLSFIHGMYMKIVIMMHMMTILQAIQNTQMTVMTMNMTSQMKIQMILIKNG